MDTFSSSGKMKLHIYSQLGTWEVRIGTLLSHMIIIGIKSANKYKVLKIVSVQYMLDIITYALSPTHNLTIHRVFNNIWKWGCTGTEIK